MAATSYLERLLDPLTEAFTPDVAAALLELRADSEVEAHIGELRRKANDGTLTPAEGAGYLDSQVKQQQKNEPARVALRSPAESPGCYSNGQT